MGNGVKDANAQVKEWAVVVIDGDLVSQMRRPSAILIARNEIVAVPLALGAQQVHAQQLCFHHGHVRVNVLRRVKVIMHGRPRIRAAQQIQQHHDVDLLKAFRGCEERRLRCANRKWRLLGPLLGQVA